MAANQSQPVSVGNLRAALNDPTFYDQVSTLTFSLTGASARENIAAVESVTGNLLELSGGEVTIKRLGLYAVELEYTQRFYGLPDDYSPGTKYMCTSYKVAPLGEIVTRSNRDNGTFSTRSYDGSSCFESFEDYLLLAPGVQVVPTVYVDVNGTTRPDYFTCDLIGTLKFIRI